MTSFTWIVLSLFGLFSEIIVWFLLACILEILVCKYLFKFSKIVPFLSFVYLIINILYYFIMIYPGLSAGLSIHIIYGFLLILPYGSIFFVTTAIYLFFTKKIYKNKELLKSKICDL